MSWKTFVKRFAVGLTVVVALAALILVGLWLYVFGLYLPGCHGVCS